MTEGQYALGAMTMLAVWLLVVLPMVYSTPGFLTLLQSWQTLISAMVALVAAGVAYWNTNRLVRQAEELEAVRRSRKHAALRAVLPLALSKVVDYAEGSAHRLQDLLQKCADESLPRGAATPEHHLKPLPSDTLQTLRDFIEYSDQLNVAVLESTLAWIQIHEARVRDLVEPPPGRITTRTSIESSIVDAATIYAGAAVTFDYARRRGAGLPGSLSWDAVRSGLSNMQLWEDQYPRLHQILNGRQRHWTSPFEPDDVLSRMK
jgi:hypothetical protein